MPKNKKMPQFFATFLVTDAGIKPASQSLEFWAQSLYQSVIYKGRNYALPCTYSTGFKV